MPFASAFAGAQRLRPDAPGAAVALVNLAATLVILVGTPLVGLTFSLPGDGRVGFAIAAGTLRCRNIQRSKPSPGSRFALTPGGRVRLVRLSLLAATLLAAVCAERRRRLPGSRLGDRRRRRCVLPPERVLRAILGDLHAQLLRVQLHWGGVLGVARGRPENAADPTDPAYDWSGYDQIVLVRPTQNVSVVFTIFGTPAWANGGGPPTRAPT